MCPGMSASCATCWQVSAGSIWCLLVIAADESIKPQTREHFDILQLLGVQRGITVLTKSDAVDAETLEVVRLEVEEFLRGTFLESPRSPILARLVR